ncbi:MAG: Bacterial shufflon protein N-terminal constant region [Aliidongia sp.]|jgi:hypothetical protein|nr:Bacterial shufflon protein N-terminal constant region [Aliidongia sp.]
MGQGSLIAILISIVISAIVAAGVSRLTFQNNEVQADIRFGQSASTMVDATRQYAFTQRTNIINTVNAGGGAAVSFHVSDLIAAGAADPSLLPTTPTGGTWCVMFRVYNVNQLQGILTVSAEAHPLSSVDAPLAAANTGRTATGFVTAGVASGQNWSQALSAFTGAAGCNPATNAFAALITDGDSVGTTIYLCRTAVPGNPSCSTMTTVLNMGGNDINNGANVNAKRLSLTGTPATADGQAAVLDVQTQTLEATGPSSTGPLTINGNGTAIGAITAPDFFATSDERLKSPDWQPIADPCITLSQMRIGKYIQLETHLPDIGISAQSVAAAGLPELLHRRPDGFMTLNYNGLIPVIMACLLQSRAETTMTNVGGPK